MKALSPEFTAYTWAAPTDEVARLAGIDPSQVVRYDQNTPPLPLPSTRPGAVAGALAGINGYPAGGYVELRRAIAGYTGVDPDQIVLGVGADDLILLCARCFAGPGDTIAIPAAPTYPLYGIAALLAGAEVGDDDPVLTFTCRPSSPTGELRPMPAARPLVVDEAYYEYCGETAVPLVDDGVIVLRTFSKVFGSRRRADRVRARLARGRGRAERTPGARARVDRLGRARDRRARLAAGRDAGDRGARAARLGAARDRPRAAAVARELPLRAGRGRPRARRRAAPAGARRPRVRRRHPDHDPRPARRRPARRGARAARSIGPRRWRRAAGRRVRHLRATAETRIAVRLGLDGASRVAVQTGAGIYDHFLEQLAFHGGLDLVVEASGDLETGDHHTVEDTALAFGEALDKALGDRRGIARYGDAVVPMDDALARAAVDLGGRPFAELSFETEPGMAAHFFTSLAQAARMAIHIEATGRDAHHTAEAAYKAVGRALKTACGRIRPASRRRRGCCEGRRLRLPRGEHPLGRDRDAAARRRARRRRRRADLAVLPGVGAARSAMDELRRQGLDEALRARVREGRPVLGICLGLQLAVDSSEEDGGVEGLGLLPGKGGSPHRGPRAADRLGRGRRDGVLLRALLRGRGAGRHRLVGGDRRRGPLRLVPRRAVPSREERRRGRALPRPRAHAGEGAITLPRLIPCLDVAAGRVVKGVRFQGLRDVGDPVELGSAYSDRGADELVFLDVKATLEERETLVGVVRRVAEQLAIPFTVGGGIRSVADADQLLSAGADKVSVNSRGARAAEPDHRARGEARLAGGRRRDRHRGRPREDARRHDRDGARNGRVGARGAASGARGRSC